MGNVELFELCETIPKVKCSECLLYWNQGVICCTCGHLLVESESSQNFHHWRLDAFSQSRITSSRRTDLMVHGTAKLRHRNSSSWPHNARKRCIKKNFDGIHCRFQRDSVFRDSQLRIGWTEENCIEMEKLAQEDRSYCPSFEEYERDQKNWSLHDSCARPPWATLRCIRISSRAQFGVQPTGTSSIRPALHAPHFLCPSYVRAHGFVLMDRCRIWGRCNNALSDRVDRASLSPAISAARLCDFFSYVIELVKALHHGWQLCVRGIPVTGQLTNRLLQSGALLLLVVLWIVARAPLPCGNCACDLCVLGLLCSGACELPTTFSPFGVHGCTVGIDRDPPVWRPTRAPAVVVDFWSWLLTVERVWNWEDWVRIPTNPVKNYHGIIERLHLVAQKQTELQN